MRKTIILFFLGIVFLCCAEKTELPEIVMEDGIEVVLNRLEPYGVKGKPATFSLEKELEIDFERGDLAEFGLGEVEGFEADSKGNIYCICETQVFQFDSRGQYKRKFGNKGQGPGEIQYIMKWWITDSDELGLFDYSNGKILFFSEDGLFIREIKIPTNVQSYGPVYIVFLNNGNWVHQESVIDREAETNVHNLTVLNSEFEKISQLKERISYVNPFRSPRINLIITNLLIQVNSVGIYAASQQDEDFCINVYDLRGKHIRQIRKDCREVDVPKEFREKKMESYLNSTPYRVHKMEGYFPPHFPSIKNFCVDDKGRIFVETYEEGETPGSSMVDIFNPDGIYTGRVSLKSNISRLFKKDRLYCLDEKESGFQILYIFNLLWHDRNP